MKNAVIFFEGKEVCRILFDSLISLNDSNCFFIKGDEVACFPKNYGHVVTGQTSEIKVSFTSEDISNSQITPNANNL